MTVKIFKCFIASPNDTQVERDSIDSILEDINRTIGSELGFRIESFKWEKNVNPSIGTDGQDVINKQIPKDFNLFVGIFFSRLGTPTPRAGSGTEEEFNIAYNRYCNNEDVDISIYFNNDDLPQKLFDKNQFDKLLSFKERVRGLGVFTSPYCGAEDFSIKFRNHITNIMVKRFSDKDGGSYKNSDVVLSLLNNRLNDSLSYFSNQPIIWVERSLSQTAKVSKDASINEDNSYDALDLISSGGSYFVKAPPQFGLTSLAHYLVKNAWELGEYWVHLDAKKIRPENIEKYIDKDKRSLLISDLNVSGVILDSWSASLSGSKKLLKAVSDYLSDKPLIVMNTIDDSKFSVDDSNVSISRVFKTLNLLALPAGRVRQFVNKYNDYRYIDEDDVVLNKVLKDMEALNIHRTPSNCLTLLKVCEKNFEESPVNRTKMIEMFLYAIFDTGEIPTYKSKPDIKDCEYLLGNFCSEMISSGCYEFKREDFISKGLKFCEENLIYLDVDLVFDILYSNNVISSYEGVYFFRTSYWIYYFSAKRMYVDKVFRDEILKGDVYLSFPDIIDFYTGIDRNRTEVLEILVDDIAKTSSIVAEKTGILFKFNPLEYVKGQVSDSGFEEMKSIINEEVQASKLPDALKDRHADKFYNQLRPYDQTISRIMNDYSFGALIQKIKACSRALRNSDYADPSVKIRLMKEITTGWRHVSVILFTLAPLLAENGSAMYENHAFHLDDSFDSDPNQRFKQILLGNPLNVVQIFKDDLSSDKIGPVIYNQLSSEADKMIKHLMILFLIHTRPKNFKSSIESYMASVQKDSFYLLDTIEHIRYKYKYDFASASDLNLLKTLLLYGLAKNKFGSDVPTAGQIRQIDNRHIPKRDVADV